jgi:hypothetical protein
VGASAYSGDRPSELELHKEADRKMYAAKRARLGAQPRKADVGAAIEADAVATVGETLTGRFQFSQLGCDQVGHRFFAAVRGHARECRVRPVACSAIALPNSMICMRLSAMGVSFAGE